MSFKAQYDGHCSDCGQAIKKGQQLTYVEDTPYAVHLSCPEPTRGEQCGRCFMEKSVSGACGCDE